MNEAQTRAEHIEPALRASGWGVTPGSKILREYRITEGRKQGPNRRSPAEVADFVLYFRNQKLAIVEAKAWARPLTEGVAQASGSLGRDGPLPGDDFVHNLRGPSQNLRQVQNHDGDQLRRFHR